MLSTFKQEKREREREREREKNKTIMQTLTRLCEPITVETECPNTLAGQGGWDRALFVTLQYYNNWEWTLGPTGTDLVRPRPMGYGE